LNRYRPFSVLLTTEGTYPFYSGGVSTWCHRLTHGLPEVEFRVLAVVTNPFPQSKYELAPNVREVLKVPQWGLLQPAEYSWHQPVSALLQHRWNTTPHVIGRQFKPLFERFLTLLLGSDCDPAELGQVLLAMHGYFQRYDYQITMNSVAVWNVFQTTARAAWQGWSGGADPPALADLKLAYRLLYHLVTVLHFPIPTADITHSSAAGICGLPCVLAKLSRGTPFLLTEHGVYLREQYLNLRRQIKSFFVRSFLLRFASAVVQANYHFADQVSPVCDYNARWETKLGVPRDRISVIFNGVDPNRFHRHEPQPKDRPLICTVGLIYPLKSQLDLIEATGLLKGKLSFPNIETRFYGVESDPKYFQACVQRVHDLQLEDNVTFVGSTKEPWGVYSNADVVAFSSISEGFPYVVVEAMLCGAAIVATDVGGVREALGECGLLVPAKAPQDMAQAIAFLLANPQERERLGRMAQERALRYFTEETFLATYENAYGTLLFGRQVDLLAA
jgi:glycosyltransferase involved in cell wall biosynthesis